MVCSNRHKKQTQEATPVKKAKPAAATAAQHMTVHRQSRSLLFRAAATATEAIHARRSATAEVHHEVRDSRVAAHAVEAAEEVHVAVAEDADNPTPTDT